MTSIPTPAQLSSSKPNPSKVNSTVLGFLAGLALKGGLDTLCKGFSDARNMHEVWYLTGIIPLISFGIFFITILRFLYGAYRFQEEEANPSSPAPEWWVLIWNVGGALVLFMLFYVTGLALRHPYPFFTFLLVVHIADLIWFAVSMRSVSISSSLHKVMKSFVGIDISTCIMLGLLIVAEKVIAVPDSLFVGLGVLIMLIFASIDIKSNFDFFFRPEVWRKLS